MRFSRFLKLVLLLAVFGPLLSPRAEIAPRYYTEMQETAPEHLEIQVTKVNRGLRVFGGNQPVTVTAVVREVRQSQTGLQVGQTIRIQYTHFKPNRRWVGPRPIPLLEKGRTYPAFLSWSDDEQVYRPAARGASFEPLIRLEEY